MRWLLSGLALRVFQMRAGCVEVVYAGDAARGLVVEEDRHYSVKSDDRPEGSRADRWQRGARRCTGEHRNRVTQ